MVEFDCIHCGKKISRDFDTFADFVICPACNEKTAVFVKDGELITTDYSNDDIREILS